MNPAILDTDTISYFFRGNSSVVAKVDEHIQEVGPVYVSVVTYYEVINGLYFKDAKKQLAKFEEFVNLNSILQLTTEIARSSARIFADLRATGQTIGHNDVLIAGTAIVHDFILIANNTSHFSRIPGLMTENWTTE